MTADLLHSRAVKRLTEIRTAEISNLRRCKPRAPTEMPSGAVIPSPDCQEIALFAVHTNATIDALDTAIAAIQDEYKKMVSPEQADEPGTTTGKEPLYG